MIFVKQGFSSWLANADNLDIKGTDSKQIDSRAQLLQPFGERYLEKDTHKLAQNNSFRLLTYVSEIDLVSSWSQPQKHI